MPVAKDDTPPKINKYSEILLKIFNNHYKAGAKSFEFGREEVEQVAKSVGFGVKNLGDLIYSFRFRTKMPPAITRTESKGLEWVIELAGRSKYRMSLTKINRIVPRKDAFEIKVPDATPEIIRKHAHTDEQAVLARVRYNRLIDIFLGLTAYSLQNHLRTTVPGIGQIETDEIYVGIKKSGEQFIIPVQAKGGNDQLGVVQMKQDLALCIKAYPALTPRLVAVQFIRSREVIVMFELVVDGDTIKIADERHYKLVPGAEISDDDLKTMKARG